MLRSVFMGTPDFSLPALDTTKELTELSLVVTQPDRPAGRGRKLRPPPVKERALELGIEVAQPTASVTKELGPRIEEICPDVIVVAAFGKILGRKILRMPRLGCINIHASLLPRHRGSSPPVWAILSGDGETGLTVQQMVSEMDAGDILAQSRTTIEPNETAGELTSRLSSMGKEIMLELLPKLEMGKVPATVQDHGQATFAPLLTKKDGEMDWTKSARQVHDHVRAMKPWPVAYTFCSAGRLRIHQTRLLVDGGVHGTPGQVITADRGGVHVACGTGIIELLEAQREGKTVASTVEIVCGRSVCSEEVLGSQSRGEGGG